SRSSHRLSSSLPTEEIVAVERKFACLNALMQLASWISPLHRLFVESRSFTAHFAWLSGPTLWPRPAKLMNPLGGSRGITPFLATSRSGQLDDRPRTVSSVSGSAREGQPPDIHPRGLRSAGAAAAVCDVYNYASAGQ